MKSDYDAIIIGGGPAGSTAAILLAQAGWSVAVVEQHAFPRRKVCGECIAAPNLGLLDALGVGSQFDELAGPELHRVGLFAGEQMLSADLPRFDEAAHPWGRALGREHLDTLLLRRAAACGAEVWQPWRVKRVEYAPGQRKTCHLVDHANGAVATLSAPVLIAAHGSWEPDPLSEHHQHPAHRDHDLFAFKGTYRDACLAPGVLPLLAFPGGYGGMVLGDHGHLTFAFCIRRDTLRRCREDSSESAAALAAQAYVARHCAGVRDALAHAELDAPWLAVGPIRPGVRSPWRDDAVFAIGNSAGEAHPILGEGISMAIQSAWMLCEVLIPQRAELLAGRAADEVGRHYAARWRRSFTARIRIAALFAHLAMRPRASAALLPLLRRYPRILTAGARLGAKVRRVVTADDIRATST
jgi:2-polyprenyl-6-methoxyphenol hydroxylase-like FAD-dependent oxidoreductase